MSATRPSNAGGRRVLHAPPSGRLMCDTPSSHTHHVVVRGQRLHGSHAPCQLCRLAEVVAKPLREAEEALVVRGLAALLARAARDNLAEARILAAARGLGHRREESLVRAPDRGRERRPRGHRHTRTHDEHTALSARSSAGRGAGERRCEALGAQRARTTASLPVPRAPRVETGEQPAVCFAGGRGAAALLVVAPSVCTVLPTHLLTVVTSTRPAFLRSAEAVTLSLEESVPRYAYSRPEAARCDDGGALLAIPNGGK